MKKLVFIICCLVSQVAFCQTPGWANKARKGIFSIITYDKTNKILNTGNGFFISEQGVALSDFSTFKGADHAVIVDSDGKQMPIESILGINSIYDVVKFQVRVNKKIQAFSVANKKSQIGETVYLLPYSTQKDDICRSGSIEKVDSIENDNQYYTLNLRTTDKTVSCPIMNAGGEVVGIVQKGTASENEKSYAVGALLGKNLEIPPLGTNDYPYTDTAIKKALPSDENKALVALFMNATGDQKTYENMLNDFISRYPNNSEGYLRRAQFNANYRDESHFAQAETDLDKALKLAQKKDDVLYNFSKIVYTNDILEPPFTYKDWTLDKAIELIDKAKAINDMSIYEQHKGNIYFAKKDYQKSYDSFNAVNNSTIASAESYLSAAQCKELLGQPAEAIALADTAVAKAGNQILIYLDERAQMKSRLGKARDAVKDFNEIYDKMNGQVNSNFFYNRSKAEMQSKMFQQGIEDIEKAVELSPDNTLYLAEQASTYIRFNRMDEAMAAARKAIDSNPNFADSYRLLGYCQAVKGMKDEAIKNLTKAKELGDDKAEGIIEKYCK